MSSTFNKRSPIASFVVAKRGTSLYQPTTNTHLNGSNGAIVLADGQLGFFGEDGTLTNLSLKSTDTTVLADKVAIYQGTPDSANPAMIKFQGPLFTRPFEKTQTIDFRRPVTVTKQAYTPGTLSTYVIKNITAVPYATFSVNVNFRGRHTQVMGSAQEAIALNAQFNTPNYTSGQLATAAPVSEIISQLTTTILRNSYAINQGVTRQGNYPVMALAVDTTAASGVVISSLAAGTILPILIDAYGTKSITLNSEMAESIKAAAIAAGLSTADTIVPANNASPVLADAMFIIGLDRNPAIKDYEWMVKTRLEVGLTSGFALSSVYCKQVSFAKEEQGSARSLNNKYLFTQGQRKYNLLDVKDPVVNFPSPFTDLTETYNMFIVTHEYGLMVDHANSMLQTFTEYVCIPTPVKGTSATTGLTDDIETRLNSLLASSSNGGSIVL